MQQQGCTAGHDIGAIVNDTSGHSTLKCYAGTWHCYAQYMTLVVQYMTLIGTVIILMGTERALLGTAYNTQCWTVHHTDMSNDINDMWVQSTTHTLDSTWNCNARTVITLISTVQCKYTTLTDTVFDTEVQYMTHIVRTNVSHCYREYIAQIIGHNK